ncbi:bifunctional tRNA (5-methylaminomethyl-2-thiouridine)(34)-methyltransferase MnmD/FAD-dependent 5-carboxymethylaminomethyl-2-thiouridine(34) oxidoreductase MnmC [Aquabacterium sp.]|uniref:bifunctional tRNA (5-methylaminomethyl-2-thiouridine)(34)-methyltransferase MnmD/FAD-dependent 5-carboxymethylaminomethyl-2-thiouridine(34) oxidoreductase MnmC n=1 Tax=Aquabacterium sp. TaxID=1872578 RepID=UPI0035B0CCC1
MKTSPIVPATLEPAPAGVSPHDATDGAPYSPLFNDVYHASAGAHEQARHVFLHGNGLPARWQGRDRFVILETGFGLGNNFLATWAAWRADAQRCERLIFVSIEKHPLTRDDLARVHATQADSAGPETAALARELVERWPALTPNVHTLSFEDSRVQLLLCLGDAADVLGALDAEVDAFYLDGFAPAKNPEMWSEHVMQRLPRLAAPGATAATWSVARGVRDGLQAAHFEVQRTEGFADKREMLTAHHAPRHRAPRPAGAPRTPRLGPEQRHALIIGAGLAGCSAAWALAEQGWRATVLDRHGEPATQTSGNPAGLFHGILNADDGIHARLYRAAALTLVQVLRPWIAQGRVQGSCAGLLRLEERLSNEEAHALLQKTGLPASYVHWLDQAQARERSGLPVPSGGWLFAEGGWTQPDALARTMLDTSGAHFMGHHDVHHLSHENGLWIAWNAQGQRLAQAPVVVIANGHSARELLAPSGWPPLEHAPIQLNPVRGQLCWLPDTDARARVPRLPVTGAAYAIHTNDGRIVLGATSQHNDPDPTVRPQEHLSIAEDAAQIGVFDPDTLARLTPDAFAGRVAWRPVTGDRLPIIGPVAARLTPENTPRRADHPRHYPRLQDDTSGLYLLTGMGSRGVTWSALAGRVLACWVSGCPAPVESDLLHAMDPARFELKSRPAA